MTLLEQTNNISREALRHRFCTSCGARTPAKVKDCLGCRIKASISILPSTNCWLWDGAKRKGLGVIAVTAGGKRSNQGVHRVACAIWLQDAPYGAQIETMCGNRDCVNPNHLVVKIGPTLRESLGF